MTEHVYKLDALSSGYLSIRTTLGSSDRKIHIIVHKAVAYTFIPNPNNLPEVNHKDGDKTNNNVNNLEWCTSHYNQQHKYNSGLLDKQKITGENNHAAKLTWDDVSFIRENCKPGVKGCGISTFAKRFNVSYPVVKRVVENTGWVDIEYTGR